MPQYVSCVDVSNVTLGDGAAATLTPGGGAQGNVLLGVGAGRAIATGSGNVILGNAPGTATASNTIVLSTGGTGAVRAAWNTNGDLQLCVRDITQNTDTLGANVCTLGYDTTTNQLVFRHSPDGTTTYTSRFRTDAEVTALAGTAAPLTEATSTGTSLVASLSTRSVKRLAAGTNISLDDTTVTGQVIVNGPTDAQIGAKAALTETTGVAGTTVSVIANAGARTLKRLVQGANITLTETATAVTIAGSVAGAADIDGLADGVSNAGNVCLGSLSGANLTVGSADGNTFLGVGSGNAVTNKLSNTLLGSSAGRALTGSLNTGVGADALRNCTAGTSTYNACLGVSAGYGITGSNNVAVGYNAASAAGSNNTMIGHGAGTGVTGSTNVLIGSGAGSSLGTGSNNVVVGGWTGTANVSNNVVLATGSGTVVMQWGDGANAVQRLDGGTLSFAYNATQQGLNATIVMSGQTYTVELTNERQIGTTITSTTVSLASVHRNRFTQINGSSAVTFTLTAYTGIVVGSEHEFMHIGSSTMTFAAGTGVTILSVGSLRNITQYGAVVVKYLGSSTFALIGALE